MNARRSGSPGSGQGGRGARPSPTTGSRPNPKRGRRRPAGPPVDGHDPDGVRLQKVLAGAGLGSRRACEAIITAGRVSVDGEQVRELGVRVDPRTAVVHVDGLRLQLDEATVTLALNKPVGVYSTMSDEQGRPDLSGFVANRSERLFHVGRLDAETDGLLLLTNDGELAHRLAHPSYEVLKTYVARVQGRVARGLGRDLKGGVELDDGSVQVHEFSVLETTPKASVVELTLHEGRNHIVRRLLEHVGHPVTRLTRTRIGPIHLGQLKSGRTRVIEGKELGRLMSDVGL